MTARSNCLIFAIANRLRHGGKIKWRKSHYGWWPHFFWIDRDNRTWSFRPNGPKTPRRAPPLFFHGSIFEGDTQWPLT